VAIKASEHYIQLDGISSDLTKVLIACGGIYNYFHSLHERFVGLEIQTVTFQLLFSR